MKVFDFEHHYNNKVFLEHLKTRKDYPYMDENDVLWYRKNVMMPPGATSLNGSTTIENEIQDLDDIRLGIMDGGNVSCGIISSSPGIEDLPPQESVKCAKATNDAVAAACKRHPGRLMGSIALPAKDVEASVKELDRAVKELGLLYWHTHSNYLDSFVYEEKYEPIFAKCAELGIPIYIHPHYAPNAGVGYIDHKDLGIFEFTVDTTRTLLILVKNGIFDRYPNLQIIIGHGGEFLAYGMDRDDNRSLMIEEKYAPCKMEQTLTTYFKRHNILMTTSGIYDPAVIHFLIECIGIDSILFATDYPYEEFAQQFHFINNLDLTPEQKEQIFHGNADRFIFKKPEAIEKYGPVLNYSKPISDQEAEKIALRMTGASDMDGVCAEINRAPHAYIPNLLRANVSLRQVALMKRCTRWSLKEYFGVNV